MNAGDSDSRITWKKFLSELLSPEAVGVGLLGIWLVILPGALAWKVCTIWPDTSTKIRFDENGKQIPPKDAGQEGANSPGDDERTIIWLAVYCGALGASIRALSSFLYFLGNKKLSMEWVPWYLGRPVIGLGLAVIIYFAFRAGFVGLGTTDFKTINVFGVSAISTIVGLFSTQAMEKLKQVAESVFVKAPTQSGSMDSSKPQIRELKPAELTGTQGGEVVVHGSGFTRESKVYVDGHEATRTLRSDAALVIDVNAGWLQGQTTVDIYVKNPPPGGGTSEHIELKVN